ncbi:MAG: TonB-dependent receptor domain-containing protein [bacterium]
MKSPNLFLKLAISAALCSTVAVYAQETKTNDSDEAKDKVTEEVVITGSRIRQNPLEVRTPVQVLNKEDMEKTGAVSIAEFLQKMPISGSAINRANNSSGNLGFPPDGAGIGAGAAEVDLRYLSSKRVLVLVDGRRWVRGSSASGVSGAVDLNTIPSNAIKSIEILQDGASAVYGSDAIGGVVNIITQDNYKGFKATTYLGQYGEGDGETQEVDLSVGSSSERSRLFMDVSFTDQKSVSAADRDISFYPIFGFPHGLSSGTPAGRFVFTDPRTGGVVSIAPNHTLPSFDPNNPGSGDFHPFTLDDRFNYQVYNHLLTPNKRLSVFSKAEFDLTDKITFRALASFNNRKSQSQAAPEPLFFGPAGGGGAFMENIFWPADHPYNPFGVDLGPDEIIFLTRRPIEAGPRIFDQNVDTWYVSTGFDGELDFGDSPIYWDTTLIWSQNQANQVKHGAFNARNLSIALGPVDVCNATPGCTPFNFVGEGSITQEMLDYVTFIQKDESRQTLFDFSFNLSGSLAGLSAGDIGYAVGYEHRKEDGSFTPDAVVSAGETAGVPASPTDGGFEVDEIYAEVVVPLLKTDGGQKLDMSAAIRNSDYNLFGSNTVGKLGLNFAPMDDILIRASYSEGFRAPNIGELFNTGSRFDAGINDPCSNASAENQANCTALGVPTGYVSLNPQTSVTTGGNTNLTPETAETWTVGFTWDMSFADNISFLDSLLMEMNYYDITVDNAIQAPNAQDILNRCVDTLDPLFCSTITRTPDGTVTRIEGVLQNIGGIETSGFDWSLTAMSPMTDYGQFRVAWNNTVLNDYVEITQGPNGDIRTDRAGFEVGSPEKGFFKYKSTVNLDWYKGDFSAGITFRYTDSLTENCAGALPDFELTDLCSDAPNTNKLDSAVFTDAQVTWNPDFDNQRWTFKVGAENLFDEDIPVCYSCDLNSFDGTLYPIPGAFYYVRASFKIN